MTEVLSTNIPNTNLTILHNAKSSSNPYKVEAADRTLWIHNTAQSPKAHKIGAGFTRLAADVVNGVVAALVCTPQLHRSCMLSLLEIVRSIEIFVRKKLSQSRLHRLWRQRSDQRKVVTYRNALRRQCAMLGLQYHDEHPPHRRNLTNGDPDHTIDNAHTPSPDSLPSQHVPSTEPSPLRRPGQQTREPHPTPATPALSFPQPPYPPVLGSQMTVFIIDSLTANFPTITANYDSGNVINTTLVGSAVWIYPLFMLFDFLFLVLYHKYPDRCQVTYVWLVSVYAPRRYFTVQASTAV